MQTTPRTFGIAALLSASLLTMPAAAQASLSPGQTVQAPADPQQPSVADKPDAPQPDDAAKKNDPPAGTSNDRLFWALPNFLTVEKSQHVPPLTTKQKFDVTTRTAFDVSDYGWYVFLAGIRQVDNEEPSYGGGLEGYGKRYALTFADGTTENFMVSALFASALHQDPRYYRMGMGEGGFWHRAGYAISRIVVTRGDSGHAQFNVSELGGSAAAAGLYDTYHPAGDRTAAKTFTLWWTQVSYDTLSIVLKEFWPDIRRKL